METKVFKRLPYCISDFKHIMLNNYAYVDKTRFIEMLENESNPSQFFIRPRKFGKSLFFTTLMYYYDINEAENFDALFGNLYIGKHPTPKRNSYAVINFDFSGLDTENAEVFRDSFSNNIQDTVKDFFIAYEHILPNATRYFRQIEEENPGVRSLQKVFSSVRQKKIDLFVIIDEYDQFASDLIAKGTYPGKDIYKIMVTANGLVRDFYERIKTAAKTFIVSRTFITGISPVMLDDMTSGYNIATNFTLDPGYNEMLGFTRAEVEWLMNETGIDPTTINIDMEAYYNGYLFHPDGENRVYNPTMVLYIFDQILRSKEMPENVIDENLKMDYSRLRNLIQSENNREILIKIIEEGGVVSEILKQFSVERMNDSRHFISLLFYLGLLTVKERHVLGLLLCIPNYSIKTLYWEYLAELIKDTSPDIKIDHLPLKNAIAAMATEGDLNRFISYVSENAFSKLSDHDLQRFDEKYIKILLLAYLFMSKIYISMSEYETVPGRADIFLQRNPNSLQLQARYEWILELKYCQVSATETEIAAKRDKALEQIDKYINAYRIKDRTDLKAAAIVFIGKDRFEITEVL